jgi:NAD(P)-dependent dehydrogenase (short-subunit alcohol dehydrogenase family)
LVTGATGDAGEKIVDQLIQEGAYVIIHYNSNINKAQELEKKYPQKCITIKSDFSDPLNAVSLWETALSWKGKVDFLINNAGVLAFSSYEDSDEKHVNIWKKTININLVSAAVLCKKAVEYFLSEKKPGIIINISSRTADNGYPIDGMHYAASKAGLIALSKSIAVTYASAGILSYVISPGCMETKMLHTIDDATLEELKLQIPSKKFVGTDEIASLVLFLCSRKIPNATGSSIDINGASYLR